MAWFPCNIGGGSKEPIIIKDLISRMTSDTTPAGECSASYVYPNRYAYYGFTTNSRGNKNDATQFWYLNKGSSSSYIQYDFGKTVTIYRIYFGCADENQYINRQIKIQVSSDGIDWQDDATYTLNTYEYVSYELLTPRVCRYFRIVCLTESAYSLSGIQAQGYEGSEYISGNATVKQGAFVSASTQYGIVDVDLGFKPDMLMVKLPFTGGDTVSYWEKSLSYAQNSAIWCLKPAENVSYEIALGRQSGETGIQAINDNGFSFMSNGWNTRNVTCEYIAVKYEA